MKEIYIIGIGMGNPRTISVEGKQNIEKCHAIIGARRMVDSFVAPHQGRWYAIEPQEILDWVEEEQATPIGILMSGDTGFYSGARKLGELILDKYGSTKGSKDFAVTYVPGISTMSYFSAKLGISWEDTRAVSLHGRAGNAIGEVARSHKTFFLTDGGQNTVEAICKQLVFEELGHVIVHVGEQLSYEEETISSGRAEEMTGKSYHSLSAMIVINEEFKNREKITLGISDREFARGEVPMTKEEIRTITVSKLNLCGAETVYDIGAGTGSVSVEMALACPLGRVYAIEANSKGIELIEENKKKFAIRNLQVIGGMAPSAMTELPKPDKAFIGGSKGNLKQILEVLLAKNPKIRIVINAVTLETLSETIECVKLLSFENVEILQVSIAKAKSLGDYHLMMGQNPIYIIAADGREEKQK